MIDYNKPILNKEGEPLKIGEIAAHHCIRVIKKSRALKSVGYKVYGAGDKPSYGTDEHDVYFLYNNKKQFKNTIRMMVNEGVDVIVWNNEPDHPVEIIRNVLKEMNVEDEVKLIADLHDLDSIRKEIIPIPERQMFNLSDGVVYVSQSIQDITNKLHCYTKPNITLFSYCNKDIHNYDFDKSIPNRQGIVYEGGANPPDDDQLNLQFSYRSLYGIIKRLVELGNQTHMFCGNLSAFNTYQNIGAIVYPPTMYDKMMENLIKFKYGVLIFNNEDGQKQQVNYTLTNKMFEYLKCGMPSLACWCPESEKYVKKHDIGFTFDHIDQIKDCSQLEEQYLDKIKTIKQKREELVMETFIHKYENLFAEVLGVEKKGVPKHIKSSHIFEYGQKDFDYTFK